MGTGIYTHEHTCTSRSPKAIVFGPTEGEQVCEHEPYKPISKHQTLNHKFQNLKPKLPKLHAVKLQVLLVVPATLQLYQCVSLKGLT